MDISTKAFLVDPVYGAVSCEVKMLNGLGLIFNTDSKHEAADRVNP